MPVVRRAVAFAAALLLAQAPAPTAGQLLDQIDALLRQLRAQLAPARPAVTTADGLTAALLQGGAIALAPGTYTGNFTVTKPTVLTGAGQALTTLAPRDLLQPTLQGYTVDDVTVQDLTVQSGAPDRDAVVFGSLSAKTAAEQPHRVRLQRISVTAVNGGHRGVALHGTDMTLADSRVTGFWEKGRDSQAVWLCNGPGPYTITGNVLEASGENVLACGADPGIPGVVPSDILIANNDIRKPGTYRGLGTVKNLLELKSARRVRIEGNRFDGNWKDGQAGNAIVLTVRNQDGGCPWCEVSDVTFTGNTVRNAADGYAVAILGYDDTHPSAQSVNVTVDHNLFADSPQGILLVNGVYGAGLTVTNNTFPKVTGKLLQFDWSAGRPRTPTPLAFSRNVGAAGEYGVMGDGSTGPGLPSLLANAVLREWAGNVIEQSGARTIQFPAGTTLVAPGGLLSLLDPLTWKLRGGGAGY